MHIHRMSIHRSTASDVDDLVDTPVDLDDSALWISSKRVLNDSDARKHDLFNTGRDASSG